MTEKGGMRERKREKDSEREEERERDNLGIPLRHDSSGIDERTLPFTIATTRTAIATKLHLRMRELWW